MFSLNWTLLWTFIQSSAAVQHVPRTGYKTGHKTPVFVLLFFQVLFRQKMCLTFKKFSFATWCIILQEVSIRIWVHCSHKGMDMVSNHIRLGCLNDAQLVLRAPKCAKKISPTPLHHHHHQSEPLRQGRMDKFKTLDKTNKINTILCRLHFYLLAFHQKCEQTVNISRERVGAE